MKDLPPIPSPFGKRWREFRFEHLPKVMFAGALASAVVMWRGVRPGEAASPEEVVIVASPSTNSVPEIGRAVSALSGTNEAPSTTND